MARRKRLLGGRLASWLGRPAPLRAEQLEDRLAPAVTVSLSGPPVAPWTFVGPATLQSGTTLDTTSSLNGASRAGDVLTGQLSAPVASPANPNVAYMGSPAGVYWTGTYTAAAPTWFRTNTAGLGT